VLFIFIFTHFSFENCNSSSVCANWFAKHVSFAVIVNKITRGVRELFQTVVGALSAGLRFNLIRESAPPRLLCRAHEIESLVHVTPLSLAELITWNELTICDASQTNETHTLSLQFSLVRTMCDRDKSNCVENGAVPVSAAAFHARELIME
jgi:hypothetical protein